MRRRASARTVWTLLAALAAVNAALVAAVETAPPRWHDPEYGTRLGYFKQRQAENCDRKFIVVLGSSRVAIGLHPASIEPQKSGEPALFNMALVGGGPVMELLTFRRLMADGVRPDAVLVEYWPAFLNETGTYHEAARLDRHRLRPCDAQTVREFFPEATYGDWQCSRLDPVGTQRRNAWNQLLPGGLPRAGRIDGLWKRIDPWGRLTDRDSVTDAERPGLREVHAGYYRPLFAGYEVSAVADRALRTLFRECTEAGIPAEMLQMPDNPAFAEWVPDAARKLAADHESRLRADLGVPWIDAREWVTPDQMPDRIHLLTPGATIFTRRLTAELPEALR
jgi:hypothetical protein